MYISYVILNFMAESLTCFVVTMVTFPLCVYDTLLEDTEMRKEGEVNRETNPAPVRPHFLPVRPHFLSGFFLCLFCLFSPQRGCRCYRIMIDLRSLSFCRWKSPRHQTT